MRKKKRLNKLKKLVLGSLIIDDIAKRDHLLFEILKDYKIYRIKYHNLLKIRIKKYDFEFSKSFLAIKEGLKSVEMKEKTIDDYKLGFIIGTHEALLFQIFLEKGELIPLFIGKKGEFTEDEIKEVINLNLSQFKIYY